MQDDDIFNEIYKYLFHKSNNCENGYEWREVCGLMKLIDDRDPVAAAVRNEQCKQWYLDQIPKEGVGPINNEDLL